MDASTPTLLGLPRELRDQIYAYLLSHHTTRKAPPSPPFAGKRHRGQDDIFYSLDRPLTRYPPLALVNHQIHTEIKQNLTRLAQTSPTAELDLMAKGYCFYPTWTSLPSRLRRGDPLNLTVHLRIFSTEAFRPNDGWPRQPGAGFRTLLALLNHFLLSGPPLTPTPIPPPSPSLSPILTTHPPLPHLQTYRINTLTLHTTFHDLYTPDTWPATAQALLANLRKLAVSGLPRPDGVQKVRAVVEYEARERYMRFKQEWSVAERVDEGEARRWGRAGFWVVGGGQGEAGEEVGLGGDA